jgi:putative PEP-CTERM system histidine kinase
VIFWTGFRHRDRLWIHRHIFAGRYDYRQYWIEASEKIRYTDGLEAAANGLAAVTHRALDAIDITVWLRARNPNRLELLASLGSISETCEKQIPGVVEKLVEVNIPMFKRELANRSDLGLVMELLQMANGELLVPLVSSDRLVGVMTVGSNRSGHPLDHEAIEFLRVLSGHAASEIHKAELLDTLFEAKEAEAFKNFATFVLHDLKNFASTLSLIARNSARYQDNPEFQKDAFHSVYDTAEKMKRLCNNLRLFSSTLAANRKPEDLNALVRTAVAELGTGMDCELHLELGEVPAIELDRDEIGRVLQNLILNARQAMQTRGAIVIRTGVHGGNVELVVEDTGKGMPREFLEKRLFLPFHTTKSDGLGIGLFQCKKIIEAHGGTISVTSVEGKGTIVTVRFGLGR